MTNVFVIALRFVIVRSRRFDNVITTNGTDHYTMALIFVANNCSAYYNNVNRVS